MADNYVLQKMSGKRPNLPYQAFALLCIALPSFPVFNKPFLRNSQDSSPATSEVFVANLSVELPVADFLLFPSFPVVLKILFFNKHLFRDISQVAMQQFSLLLTLPNINQPSPPLFSVDTVWQHYVLCVNSHLPPISS